MGRILYDIPMLVLHRRSGEEIINPQWLKLRRKLRRCNYSEERQEGRVILTGDNNIVKAAVHNCISLVEDLV